MDIVPPGVDPLLYAQMRLRKREFDPVIAICTDLLQKNSRDQAAKYLKCHALTQKNWIDDTEFDDEALADVILDDNATTDTPRPGTSFSRPNQSSSMNRPVTQSGRPLTGYSRPGTSSRPTTSSVSVRRTMTAFRQGTARPTTNAGRIVRLGTASVQQFGGQFIDINKMDMTRQSRNPEFSKVLCDYILMVEHNPRIALELAARCTVRSDYNDWFWKARLGKAYYQLGHYRDAEKQYKSSLKLEEILTTYLELIKVYIRLDLPNTALDWCVRASRRYPKDVSLLLTQARILDGMGEFSKSADIYAQIVTIDSSNVEAIACLGSHYFYNDRPEVGLRFYRRLLQMGVVSAEVWTNMGLCSFYSGQYDIALRCFDSALKQCSDEVAADIWYNISHIAIAISDRGVAYQALKLAISYNPEHPEALNNLGVLELRRDNLDQAASHFRNCLEIQDNLFQPEYNLALLFQKFGDFQEAFIHAKKAHEIQPEHEQSKTMLGELELYFNSV
eukprot:TRINITY_DN3159_c3_g1_i1.p1 TRINITY_DN3159_c3_g1~~TRINITY_DN3159_c3_g1_i1.p1  ORF type:complete len:503 (+),score=104.90 TRINITY_DN3159_c3_g1_i1:835-2343(+)